MAWPDGGGSFKAMARLGWISSHSCSELAAVVLGRVRGGTSSSCGSNCPQ